MKSLLKSLQGNKILVSDGAWGTFLMQRGLQPGECPELWNVTHKNDVLAIAKSYVDAGADIILTNSFGGSPIKLSQYGLHDRAYELNKLAGEISREAAGKNHFVLGSIGPTGAMLLTDDVSEHEMYDGFCLQAEALRDGGVDAICIETMSAIDEAALAVKAAKATTGLEVVCTFTYEKKVGEHFRTMMGVAPQEMVSVIKEAGADIIGANCGNGFEQMIEIVKDIRSNDKDVPILIHANAGLPKYEDGKIVYAETPELMASRVKELISCGANIVGGCCGTTPAHIEALVKEVKKF